jgi:hypothetical protein
MTKIAELKDKGAVVAWSPIGGEGENNYADVIALGSKVRVSTALRCVCVGGLKHTLTCRD